MTEIIKQRVFERRRLVGMLVALKVGDKVNVGWSKCMISQDHFKKGLSSQIAAGRAVEGATKEKVEVPHCVRSTLPSFMNRIKSYFRASEDNVVVWGVTPPPAKVVKKVAKKKVAAAKKAVK